MTQESTAINIIGQVVSTAYSGTVGAAAYSGWQSYHASSGNWHQAFKSASVSAVTSYANDGVLRAFPGSSQLGSRVVVGGLLAQASGGEFKSGLASAAVGELGNGLLLQSSSLAGHGVPQSVDRLHRRAHRVHRLRRRRARVSEFDRNARCPAA